MRKAGSLLFSAALALAFSLVFFAFNTPLGPSIGSDNAIYLTLGTALARGSAPYTGIFDHKGPVLFVLQWLPQALSGGYSTRAVFLQELVFLFLCLRVLAAFARERNAPEAPAQLVYLALFAPLAGGGNLTEEYTNLAALLGLLALYRVFSRPLSALPADGRGLAGPAALTGACFSFCFLTRANNALPLAAMALTLAAALAASRRAAAALRCAADFACGAAAFAAPVCLWLLRRGALGGAFYGAILHNLMYAGTEGGSRLGTLLRTPYGHLALLIFALACLGALTQLRRAPALCLAALAGAAAGLAAGFVSHKFYQHYLQIGVPLAACGAALLTRGKGRGRRALRLAACCLCLAALLWQGRRTNAWRLAERADLPAFAADAQALYAEVPEEDRGRFMAYRVEPRWYAVTRALPCMRFFFLQETLAEANPAVMDEIVSEFGTDPPLWLVIYYNREFSPPYDPRVQEIFETRYAFVKAAGSYQLLQLER